ncbi:Cyclin-D5-1 [Bienertia sinuspersici]
MEESKVPALSEYKVEDFECGSSVIQHMELIVLTTLEWNMNLITPFVYFNYFIKELGFQETKQELISRGNELVMGLIKECKSINDYRPFVVAAAAVMAASDWQLTHEALKSKISTVALWETSDNQQKEQQQEQLTSCYSIMQRLCLKNNPSTPMTAVEQRETASTSKVGGKRKLAFRDSGQNPDLPEDRGLG